jgi:alpha-L-arabinofuranosidase
MTSLSRREFLAGAAALSLASAFARQAPASSAERVVVRLDEEIGLIRPEFHGHFAEHLGSCIYGGLWVGPKSAIPNINGYRRQAVEYLRELGIPVLRWPGGCFADDYHWRDGIGPVERRPKRVNIHWGGYVEDNSFGTHEFIGLCRLIGAEPYLAGNVGSGSPGELRDWVEYCNMPANSTLAEERARNGSADPFRVRYWGVGNENWGCGGNMRPEHYSDLYRNFGVYVREFGGTKPFLIASGPNGNDVQWTRGLLDGMRRGQPDAVSMHFYSNGRDRATQFTAEHMQEQFGSFARLEAAIAQQRAILDGYGASRRIELLVDEWGVWDRIPPEDEAKYGKLWQQSTMRSAVAAALGLNVFNRQADKLYMCNIAQIVNVLQSLLLTDGADGQRCVRTTTYHAFALLKPHRGNTSVRTETASTALSVSASKRPGTVAVTLVNSSADADTSVDCELRGGQLASVSGQILHDPDLNACNSFEQPDRLVPRALSARIDGTHLRVDVPRLSVATLTAQVRS